MTRRGLLLAALAVASGASVPATPPYTKPHPRVYVLTRTGDVESRDLDGVPWHEAPVPPERHECWVQTDAWVGLSQVWRCACGAIALPAPGGVHWDERNSR